VIQRPTGPLWRVAADLAAAIVILLAALASSGASVFARSEAVDETVHRAAGAMSAVLPAGRVGPFESRDACVTYPVIERVPLRGWTDGATGASVPPGVIFRREAGAPERVVPLVLLLLVAGAMHMAVIASYVKRREIDNTESELCVGKRLRYECPLHLRRFKGRGAHRAAKQELLTRNRDTRVSVRFVDGSGAGMAS